MLPPLVMEKKKGTPYLKERGRWTCTAADGQALAGAGGEAPRALRVMETCRSRSLDELRGALPSRRTPPLREGLVPGATKPRNSPAGAGERRRWARGKTIKRDGGGQRECRTGRRGPGAGPG